MVMTLSSPAFKANGAIPRRHSCEGEDLSPPLRWTDAPAGTASFALVCADPDAPGGTFYHWAIFDVPPTARELAEGLAAAVPGMRQARNDFGRPGYRGPCPPRGHGPHHYHFTLYALSVPHIEVAQGADCRAVEAAAQRHSLATAELVGVYERR